MVFSGTRPDLIGVLFVLFSVVFWVAIIAVVVLLVRFLLIGTKAAQVYLRQHDARPFPPAHSGPMQPGPVQAAPAPGGRPQPGTAQAGPAPAPAPSAGHAQPPAAGHGQPPTAPTPGGSVAPGSTPAGSAPGGP